MATYQEMLRDPRWHEKRRSILKRDGYSCRICFRSDAKLQVHHCFYEFYDDCHMVPPWEYPDQSLITLCEGCHEEEKELAKRGHDALKKALGSLGWLGRDVWELANSLNECPIRDKTHILVHILCNTLTSRNALAFLDNEISKSWEYEQSIFNTTQEP